MTAIDLPSKHVERPVGLQNLKDLLLPTEPGAKLPVRRALLHGIGAIGKSVLAAAFAHDPTIEEAFPDGVLWNTLGREPNITQRLTDWGRALADPVAMTASYEDEQAGRSCLIDTLEDKACLLILDDAWDAEHVKPLLVGGERCLLLVTSRKIEVLPEATLINLGAMEEDEALALMAQWAREVPETAQAIAKELVGELGYYF